MQLVQIRAHWSRVGPLYSVTDVLANRGDRGTDPGTGSTPCEVSCSQPQAGRETWGGTSLVLSDGASISDFLRTARVHATPIVVLCYAASANCYTA